MLKSAVILLIALANLPKTTPCVAEWGQCGGINYSGDTSCCGSLTCQVLNPWYFQCLQATTTTAAVKQPTTSATTARPTTTTASPTTTSGSTAKPTTTSASTAKPTTTSASTARPTTTTAASTSSSSITQSQNCQPLYAQCGGINWSGSKTCCAGATCTYGNDYYYQCLPSGNPGTTSSPSASSSSSSSAGTAASSSTTAAGNDGRQPGVTTRYWDCCKASCGWAGKALVSNPVQTCDLDGVTPVDRNAQSICTGGRASMCNNQQPWSVNASLSYGYAAAYISGLTESQWCCACYSLLFTSGPVAGKEMIVQVTNTGGDLGNNHFDLQMPGGGVGIFDGCSTQFPGSYSWGQRYGGVSSASDCGKLPAALQPGCNWRFGWFQNADNPTMRLKQVTCPRELTANTQCVRL